ncbi:Caffeic acid 3-O-methyltransferase [Camellia lanceoleosa]|uniref:Caffeic acid 3-O-methyltransferase n=1 Tax=Camellia lanceoleosa TaxID=1840588 RepID=A0ACC0IVZ8_9ERIC|nr:Caffeic acid 3-O-methyltransferase [Camellia lanceoleosa]
MPIKIQDSGVFEEEEDSIVILQVKKNIGSCRLDIDKNHKVAIFIFGFLNSGVLLSFNSILIQLSDRGVSICILGMHSKFAEVAGSEECLTILKNCYKALPKNGKVNIIDIVLSETPDSSFGAKYATQLDNVRLLQFGGKERTKKEFELASAGLFGLTMLLGCLVLELAS